MAQWTLIYKCTSSRGNYQCHCTKVKFAGMSYSSDLKVYSEPIFRVIASCEMRAFQNNYLFEVSGLWIYLKFRSPGNIYYIQLEPQNPWWTLLSAALAMERDGISDNILFPNENTLTLVQFTQCKEPSQSLPDWNNLRNCVHLMKITRS